MIKQKNKISKPEVLVKDFKKNLRIIDLKKKNLKISKKFFLSNKIIIIKNFCKKNHFNDFIKLSKSLGNSLDYNGKPYLKFTESSQQAIGLHTDGVSCVKYKKIPKFILFYIENWPKNKEGKFKVSSTKEIIKRLSKNYIKILKENKLEYYNYNGTHKKFIKVNNKDEITFKKYCLRKINNHWTLDMFLPLKKMTKDIKWEYKMKFENFSFEESLKILKKIRDIAESRGCVFEFPLSSKMILILNNEKYFHARNRFSNKVKRSMYRIQILNKFA
tara:strand:+ start:1185 stop:2006 length:822 start_codon:yes stop_codon:yes gene_type:complete